MKTASGFLHDLVKRLSKSEKRYLKVRAGAREKDYIALMDALLAQENFDEAKLIEDNRGANFLKNLAVNKRYLYELILNSLARFGQQSPEQKIFEKLNAAQALIEKEMFAAAFSELKKGQKIADQYELFELRIMLSGVEISLLSKRQFKHEGKEAIDQVYRRVTESLEQLKNTNEYRHLSQLITQFQLSFQKVQSTEQQEYLNSLVQSPLFNSIEPASNFRSKLYYYQANATYQFILGNADKAYEVNRAFLDLLDENPHFLRLYAERYLATLNNMLIDSLVKGNYEMLQEGINRMDSIPKQAEFKYVKNIESRIFRQRYILLLNHNLKQNDFASALAQIPEIEAGLEKFGKKIEKHHRITFYYLSAYILFQTENFDRALRWNNLILNERKQDVVKEIFYFARILNLLIHYELKNYELLESLLSSTPKYLKSRRNLYESERSLIRFLGKLLRSYDRREKQKLGEDFKAEVQKHFENPKERRVFNYLDLRLWAAKPK